MRALQAISSPAHAWCTTCVSRAPPTLKIVVRENLGKLRTHSEQALLQLGTSVVVY